MLFPALLVVSVFLSTPAASASKPVEADKMLHRDHPLVGKAWQVTPGGFLSDQQYRDELLGADIVMLGEIHDNIEHHREQARVIRELARAGRDAAVAYEMISLKQGERLRGKALTSVDQLIDLLNQDVSGWDYDHQYRVVFEATLSAGYPFIATNLDSKTLMSVLMSGEGAGNEAEYSRYQQIIDRTPFSEQQQADLEREIHVSHCNLLDDNTARSMSGGQRLRDAVITANLLTIDKPVTVLIAGLGHVRNDRGLPLYLEKNLERPARVLAVGLLQVDPELTEPAAYAEFFNTDKLPFDIVVFTPKVDMGDPCIGLEKRFGKKPATNDEK